MTSVEVPRITPPQAVDEGYVVLDVRSPKEFAEGHVPGSVNLPLLDNRQRARVGTAYRTAGAQRARVVAMDEVSAGLPVYLRSAALLARGGRRLAVMCWRGGERSRNVVLLLALIGIHAAQVDGGYKGYRRWVLDGLSSWTPDRPVVTLFGHTGSGKTALLRALSEIASQLTPPRPWVIDLEGMALHRGSLLGGLHQPGQRTQKDFDALLWNALRRPQGDYMVVEGEGAKIGRLFLPESAAELVRGGIPVHLTADVGMRARRILGEYAPDRWSSSDVLRFKKGLQLIGQRLSPGELRSLRRAFDDGRFDYVVERLLVAYYDPLYHRSSVEGRDFALTLRAEPDTARQARTLAALLTPLIEKRLNA